MSLLENLRHHCEAKHHALHGHPLLASLNDDAITFKQYKTVIAMFGAAYESMEAHRQQHDTLPDAPVLCWLAKDRATHNITPATYAAQPADVSTTSKLIGYLYVKQGSTLGGQMISRNLKRALQLEPGTANHFFHGYGKETGPYWQSFRKQVTDIEEQLREDEVIEAAHHAFDAIKHCADRMAEGT